MKDLYRLSDVQDETGVDRQTLDRYVRFFRIPFDGSDKPRSKSARTRRLDQRAVNQIKLIAALKKDVRFEDFEIESILKRMSVEEFLALFISLPFPKLLEELRNRKIAIDGTKYLERLLKLQQSVAHSDKSEPQHEAQQHSSSSTE